MTNEQHVEKGLRRDYSAIHDKASLIKVESRKLVDLIDEGDEIGRPYPEELSNLAHHLLNTSLGLLDRM
jgi:hypothetical protein